MALTRVVRFRCDARTRARIEALQQRLEADSWAAVVRAAIRLLAMRELGDADPGRSTERTRKPASRRPAATKGQAPVEARPPRPVVQPPAPAAGATSPPAQARPAALTSQPVATPAQPAVSEVLWWIRQRSARGASKLSRFFVPLLKESCYDASTVAPGDRPMNPGRAPPDDLPNPRRTGPPELPLQRDHDPPRPRQRRRAGTTHQRPPRQTARLWIAQMGADSLIAGFFRWRTRRPGPTRTCDGSVPAPAVSEEQGCRGLTPFLAGKSRP